MPLFVADALGAPVEPEVKRIAARSVAELAAG